MEKGGDANVEELSTRLDVAEKRQRALVSAAAWRCRVTSIHRCC